MGIFQIGLILATVCCSLVAGLVFTFACVAMPGIATLEDGPFLRAFRVMDRVIQNGQPLFLLVWGGSVVTLGACVLMGGKLWSTGRFSSLDCWILLGAATVYFFGVQVPTMSVNVPLNNQLQALNIEVMDESDLALARREFESRWNRWNVIRTACAVLTSVLLVVLVLRL